MLLRVHRYQVYMRALVTTLEAVGLRLILFLAAMA